MSSTQRRSHFSNSKTTIKYFNLTIHKYPKNSSSTIV